MRFRLKTRGNPLARLTTLVLVGLGIALLPGTASSDDDGTPRPIFALGIVEDGAYRVSFEALAAASGPTEAIPSDAIGITVGGEPVPIHLSTARDGWFGPGDAIEFLGHHLPGEHGYHNEFSRFNVYRLDLNSPDPRRMSSLATLSATATCGDSRAPLIAHRHFEQDSIRLRLRNQTTASQEIWFQQKLTHIDPEPFGRKLELPDLDRRAGGTVSLRFHFRGWSSLPAELADAGDDHRIEIALNDRLLRAESWDNDDEGHHVTIRDLPVAWFDADPNTLTISVPKRRLGDDKRPPVDVVMLNWIEIGYPHSGHIETDQARLVLQPEEQRSCLELSSASAIEPIVYREDGIRISPSEPGKAVRWSLDTHEDSTDPVALTVVGDGGWREPDWVARRDDGSRLLATDRQADYLMLTHPRLRESVTPLAEFHRERGLDVALIDIDEVYDAFSHGIVDPRAIREFLRYASEHWQSPAPRFVLLVGDASWDPHNLDPDDATYLGKAETRKPRVRLPEIAGQRYPDETDLSSRNLVPTWSYPTYDGDAASDNWFVALDEDSSAPRMAIGRFPVTEPAEVEAIVAKTVAYVRHSGPGTWRRRMLWITNEEQYARRRSDKLAAEMEARGYESVKVYPTDEETSNEHHQATLRNAFDQGQYIVHFYGHGGRYIWRTGPPDLEKNHDLFTLEDIDLLQSGTRFPIVLSMTCYSAPFDHPSADSIGEKFLRTPGRGAVAVLAAAWRNGPTQQTSRLLLEELTVPGTVGEAIMRAKQASRHPDFINQYNLLGDPALPLAAPALEIDLTFEPGPDTVVRASLGPELSRGTARIDWLDEQGELLLSEATEWSGPEFAAVFAGAGETRPTAARIYIWDAESGRHGIGLATNEVKPASRPRKRRTRGKG